MQLAELLVQVLDMDRFGGAVAVGIGMAAALDCPASDRLRCLVASRSALVITLSHSTPPRAKMDRPPRLRQPGLRDLRAKCGKWLVASQKVNTGRTG